MNAVDNSNRELATRFDFRGVQASCELKNKKNKQVSMTAEAEFQLQQMIEIFLSKAVKRGLDVRSFKEYAIVHSGRTYRQRLTLKQGIETEVEKKSWQITQVFYRLNSEAFECLSLINFIRSYQPTTAT